MIFLDAQGNRINPNEGAFFAYKHVNENITVAYRANDEDAQILKNAIVEQMTQAGKDSAEIALEVSRNCSWEWTDPDDASTYRCVGGGCSDGKSCSKKYDADGDYWTCGCA